MQERRVMNKKLLEIGKETLRVAILAVVSYLLTAGVIDYLLVTFVGNTLSTEMVVLITGLLTSILRGVEKQLHKEDSKFILPV